MDIVKRVVMLQQAEGITDTELAHRLGVSKGLWSLTKAGKIKGGPGMLVLKGIWRAYPGMRPAVEGYLLSQVRGTGSSALVEAVA